MRYGWIRNHTFSFEDLGTEVPLDLWRTHDFVVVAFDLTSERREFESALALSCGALAQEHSVECIAIVGTKRDLISNDVYDIAVKLRQPAIEAACCKSGLKMFPVSSSTGAGYSELVNHIGKSFALVLNAMLTVGTSSTLCRAL